MEIETDNILSALQEDYALRSKLQSKGLTVDEKLQEEIRQLERQYLAEMVIPALEAYSYDLLKDLQCDVNLAILMDGNGDVRVENEDVNVEEIEHSASNDNVGIASEPEPGEGSVEVTPNVKVEKHTKAKSVGFSVSFADGTVFHEKKAVQTWLKALRKIGFDYIYDNRDNHEAWHRIDGRDVCVLEKELYARANGTSAQTLIDGYYVVTQLSNEAKIKDLQFLSKLRPDLGIVVKMDDEAQH